MTKIEKVLKEEARIFGFKVQVEIINPRLVLAIYGDGSMKGAMLIEAGDEDVEC